jgi:hypothetical protein
VAVPSPLSPGATTALAFDFFLTVPYGAFTIRSSDDIVTTVLLVVVGLVAEEIVERARRSRRRRQHSAWRWKGSIAAPSWPAGRGAKTVDRPHGRRPASMLGLVDIRYHRGPARATMAVFTSWGGLFPAARRPRAPRRWAAVRARRRDVGYLELVLAKPTDRAAVSVDTRRAAVAAVDQLGMVLLRYDRLA